VGELFGIGLACLLVVEEHPSEGLSLGEGERVEIPVKQRHAG
jgi:hypothetical protein